jgi:hypothetical protein
MTKYLHTLLQAGGVLPPAEPWSSMSNTGSW